MATASCCNAFGEEQTITPQRRKKSIAGALKASKVSCNARILSQLARKQTLQAIVNLGCKVKLHATLILPKFGLWASGVEDV
jgi:hypothetical protein